MIKHFFVGVSLVAFLVGFWNLIVMSTSLAWIESGHATFMIFISLISIGFICYSDKE